MKVWSGAWGFLQLALSPGVASSWYTMPLPLVTHLPNYLQLGLKLGFELVKLLCLLHLRVQAALLVLCELAQELLLLGQHPGTA